MSEPARRVEGHTTDAAAHPEEALDELEEQVLGGRKDQARHEDDDESEPAFEQDLDDNEAEQGPGTEPS